MKKGFNKRIDRQKGFTLIEVIAVLVLLGILAAFAVPKYMGMQADVEKETLRTAYNDMLSRTNMQYARTALTGNTAVVTGTWPLLGIANQADLNTVYQKFTGTWTYTSNTSLTYTTKYYNNGSKTVIFNLANGVDAPPSITIDGTAGLTTANF